MPRLAPELIEQIAAANDIVEVIGSYIPLRRAGSAYKALCPFHQERTPSFQVNPQRQIFKCFGCGAGGSVFRFVMDYEHLEFVAAAKKLAERAGIRIVEQELSAEDQQRYNLRRRLLALHAEAASFFHHQLMKKPGAEAARAYLKSRGISAETARSWQIGYAPDEWDAMAELAKGQGFTRDELLASGLVSLRGEDSRGDFYDRFRDRVMFPICNDTGEVIAFSGRVLDPAAKTAKYVNSPETALFIKGDVLFGLHRSKRALIDKKSAIVCEGQLDLITAFEAGIQNVIAPQGTAFTDKQARILKRYVEEVVLCFDADAAGEKAAERSLPALLEANLAVRVASMPPGEDPDSMIRGRGPEAFARQIASAKDFFEFQIDRLSGQPDFSQPRVRVQAARKMAEAISLVSEPILRASIINKASIRLEISPEEFTRMLKAPQKKAPAPDAGGPVPEPQPLLEDRTLRLLATVVLRDAAARAWVLAEEWERLLNPDPDAALLVKILSAPFNPEEPASLSAFLATLDAGEEAALSSLLEGRLPENPLTIANDCWNDLERRAIRRRLDSVQARLRAPGLGETEVLKMQKEILDLQKSLLDIARPFSPPL